jgi:hypothetical protein
MQLMCESITELLWFSDSLQTERSGLNFWYDHWWFSIHDQGQNEGEGLACTKWPDLTPSCSAADNGPWSFTIGRFTGTAT